MVPVDEKMTQCLHFIDRKQGPERPSDFLKVTQQGSSPNTGCHESQISLVLEGYDIRRWGGGSHRVPSSGSFTAYHKLSISRGHSNLDSGLGTFEICPYTRQVGCTHCGARHMLDEVELVLFAVFSSLFT